MFAKRLSMHTTKRGLWSVVTDRLSKIFSYLIIMSTQYNAQPIVCIDESKIE